MRRAVTVVGMGDDGCAGLTSRAMNAIAAAQVLVGGERQLAFVPQFRGERVVLKDGIGRALDRVAELAREHDVCVLASGDPLFYGIGPLVARKVGAEHVAFIPHPSAVQLAFARIGIRWDDAAVLSLHGRPREGFLTRLRRLRKVAVFTDGENTPARLAAHMLAHGVTGFRAWVCEDLGGPGERVRSFTVEALAAADDVGPLNVLVLERTGDFRPAPAITFLHEDAFAKRVPKAGLITKREVRLLVLAALAVQPDSVVWDIGAGSGSVAIEAAMLAFEGRAFAVEVDPECVGLIRENLRAHAVDNVHVVEGLAPAALADLPDPDAVFVGGSKGAMDEIVEHALGRLPRGGRLVTSAITLENVGETYACLRRRGLDPEVTMLNVARARPLARYRRWEAQNPIHVFAVTKP